jgi:hypothetical protein
MALAEELSQTPVMLGQHYLRKSHISAKRAKQIAAEILGLFVTAMGGL